MDEKTCKNCGNDTFKVKSRSFGYGISIALECTKCRTIEMIEE